MKTADAVVGLNELTGSGISPGATKPFVILVEHNPGSQALKTIVSRLQSTPGIDGAAAPVAWRKAGSALVEAIPSQDGAAKPVRHTISNLQHDVLPSLETQIGGNTRLTLGGGILDARSRRLRLVMYQVIPRVLSPGSRCLAWRVTIMAW